MWSYVINLDRSPERLAVMASQLDGCGIPWRRIAAVDGATFGCLPWPGFDHAAYRRRCGKEPSGSELGCYLSHVAAMRAFLGDSGESGLILEDDATLPETLPAILSAVALHKNEWDVLTLQGSHGGNPRTIAMLPDGRRIVKFRWKRARSAAYLLNRRAATSYLKRLLPMTVPFDHELEKAWKYAIRIRGILPEPVSISGARSTIVGGRKHRWWRRGMCSAYRIGIEAQRLLYNEFVD